jgi:hypothetical protein
MPRSTLRLTNLTYDGKDRSGANSFLICCNVIFNADQFYNNSPTRINIMGAFLMGDAFNWFVTAQSTTNSWQGLWSSFEEDFRLRFNDPHCVTRAQSKLHNIRQELRMCPGTDLLDHIGKFDDTICQAGAIMNDEQKINLLHQTLEPALQRLFPPTMFATYWLYKGSLIPATHQVQEAAEQQRHSTWFTANCRQDAPQQGQPAPSYCPQQQAHHAYDEQAAGPP